MTRLSTSKFEEQSAGLGLEASHWRACHRRTVPQSCFFWHHTNAPNLIASWSNDGWQNLSKPSHPIAHYLRHTLGARSGFRPKGWCAEKSRRVISHGCCYYMYWVYIYPKPPWPTTSVCFHGHKNHVELFSLHTWQCQRGCCNLIFLDEVEVRYVALLWALLAPQAILAVGSDWELSNAVSNCGTQRLWF